MDDRAWSEFQTQDFQYSPAKFYVDTGNDPDSRVSKNLGVVKFPVHVAARVDELIASRKFPVLRTFPDFVRDACQHRLFALLDMIEDPRLDVYALLIDAERAAGEQGQVERLLGTWASVLEHERDMVELQAHITNLREKALICRSAFVASELVRMADLADTRLG